MALCGFAVAPTMNLRGTETAKAFSAPVASQLGARMTRYHVRYPGRYRQVPEDKGLELRDARAAKVEAARALADIARDAVQSDNGNDVTIDVRTKEGPVVSGRLSSPNHQREVPLQMTRRTIGH
ncbi:hypothetical protein [Bradyrhizobium sp. RD5-C2]|uniref:DUF6894 family protein n=1 Tax=Bradyrhizobium sp. RD5-C2 TaxID=244562 RepID=UPI0035B56D17